MLDLSGWLACSLYVLVVCHADLRGPLDNAANT